MSALPHELLKKLSPELQEQFGRLAEIELYAIFMTPTDKYQNMTTPEGDAMLTAHLRYQFQLEDRKVLLAAGPLNLNRGPAEGMCILAVTSRQEAEAIAANDPYSQAGWRINTVRSWQVNEGALTRVLPELLPAESPPKENR